MKQVDRLKQFLETGRRINPLVSWRDLGIYRLAARINDLQEQMDIKRGWLEVENQHGEKVRVREYWV